MRSEMSAQKILEMRSLTIFRHAPAPVIGGAAALLQDREYRKNERVQETGALVPEILFLRDGRVLVDRPEGALELMAPAHLGLYYALSQVPSQATVTTTTDVRAFTLDVNDLFDLFEDHFPLLRSAIREVARQGLAENHGRLEMQIAFAKSRQKSIGQKVDLDLVDRLVFLRRLFGFPHVSVDAVASVARQMKIKTFAPGQRIWKRGEAAIDLTIVIQGTVECIADHERIVLEGGGPLGGIETFAQSARWYDLVAKTETRALVTSYDAVVDMFEEHVDMGVDLLRSLSATVLGLRQQRGEIDMKAVEPVAMDEATVEERSEESTTAEDAIA